MEGSVTLRDGLGEPERGSQALHRWVFDAIEARGNGRGDEEGGGRHVIDTRYSEVRHVSLKVLLWRTERVRRVVHQMFDEIAE